MDQPNNQTLQEKIAETIKSGKIRMRPRWHFVLRTTLLAIGAILVLLTLLYLTSFIAFILRESGVWFIPIFGSRGWFEFLISLPWVLIILTLIFIVVLELLVRHYAFAYRRPLLYSALGVIIVVLIGGFIVFSTPMHGNFMRQAERGRLPFAGPMYRDFGHRQPPNVFRGVILSTTTRGFIITAPMGETVQININPGTRLPLGADFSLGDTVVIMGDPRPDHQIEAFGIREIN